MSLSNTLYFCEIVRSGSKKRSELLLLGERMLQMYSALHSQQLQCSNSWNRQEILNRAIQILWHVWIKMDLQKKKEKFASCQRSQKSSSLQKLKSQQWAKFREQVGVFKQNNLNQHYHTTHIRNFTVQTESFRQHQGLVWTSAQLYTEAWRTHK